MPQHEILSLRSAARRQSRLNLTPIQATRDRRPIEETTVEENRALGSPLRVRNPERVRAGDLGILHQVFRRQAGEILMPAF